MTSGLCFFTGTLDGRDAGAAGDDTGDHGAGHEYGGVALGTGVGSEGNGFLFDLFELSGVAGSEGDKGARDVGSGSGVAVVLVAVILDAQSARITNRLLKKTAA